MNLYKIVMHLIRSQSMASRAEKNIEKSYW